MMEMTSVAGECPVPSILGGTNFRMIYKYLFWVFPDVHHRESYCGARALCISLLTGVAYNFKINPCMVCEMRQNGKLARLNPTKIF